MKKKEIKKRVVILSPLATGDIQSIENYISLSRDSKTAANVVDGILGRCSSLSEMPRAGKRRDELVANLRSVNSSNYIIFYRFDREAVEIVRVIHGSRDIEASISASIWKASLEPEQS